MVAYTQSYFSASSTPHAREPGPVPLPMATMFSTPAARARSSTDWRSALNCSISRWAWESTNMSEGVSPKEEWELLKPRADGDIFQEARQHRGAFFAE